MKNIILLFIFSCSMCLSITAQFISEEKNSNNYFGIFGETTGDIFNQESFYVNIGKDFIQSSVSIPNTPLASSKLKLNPDGSAVEVGGEVNRVSTGFADLLPYAYGEVSLDLITDRGTNNYTTTLGQMNGFNYTEITFNDPNLNTYDLIIVATPRSGIVTGPFNTGDASQVRIDHIDTAGSNTCRVYLYQPDGTTANHQYFSFVAYKL